jgi:hypothetical protein
MEAIDSVRPLEQVCSLFPFFHGGCISAIDHGQYWTIRGIYFFSFISHAPFLWVWLIEDDNVSRSGRWIRLALLFRSWHPKWNHFNQCARLNFFSHFDSRIVLVRAPSAAAWFLLHTSATAAGQIRVSMSARGWAVPLRPEYKSGRFANISDPVSASECVGTNEDPVALPTAAESSTTQWPLRIGLTNSHANCRTRYSRGPCSNFFLLRSGGQTIWTAFNFI